MTPRTLNERIDDFLAQKRIAVAGVSDGAQRGAARAIYHRLKAEGREVFAVNPNLDRFEDSPCWPDLSSIPGGVDAVMIVTRPEATDSLVRDAHAAGVSRVWMHASSPRGASVSQDAVAYCRQNGMSVIAGGCPMMFGDKVDFGHRCMRLMLRLSGGLADI